MMHRSMDVIVESCIEGPIGQSETLSLPHSFVELIEKVWR